MAHQLYRVIGCNPGGFEAYPIIDGSAVYPDYKLNPTADELEAMSLTVAGDFLECLIPREWIDKGHARLKAAFDAQVAEIKGVWETEAEAVAAELKAQNDAAVAASREAREAEKAKAESEPKAKAAKKPKAKAESEPEPAPDEPTS